MNNTKKKLPSTEEGWAVHFYDSNRHLRFILEPSHIWAFTWGIGVGLLLPIVWYAFYSVSHSSLTNTEHLTGLSPIPETNSRDSFHPEYCSSFPFGID